MIQKSQIQHRLSWLAAEPVNYRNKDMYQIKPKALAPQ